MLQRRIGADYIQAMKDKDSLKSATLNFLRAQIKNAVIEKRSEDLADAEVIAIIKKQIKQRQDSIEQYTKGGRAELAEKEKREMEVLQSYLPAALSGEELRQIVDEIIKETQAQSLKDMGMVMKMVLTKAGGRADNRQVSQLVKEALGA